jgi:hypothetical protein
VPEPRQLLLDRVDREAARLRRGRSALEAAAIDPVLRERVRIRFSALFEQRTTAVGRLRTALTGSALAPSAGWETLHGLVQEDDRLLREFFAFLQGALARSAALDDGICEVADRLLEDLSRDAELTWSRLTIMGDGESFDQTAEIIRLRYPPTDIWTLPLLAHELGHLAVQELTVLDPTGLSSRLPLQELAERDPTTQLKVREVISDVFGVYVAGPAFAAASLLLAFDPSRSDADASRTHPSDARRAHVVLSALRRLDDPDNPFNRPFSGLADALRAVWEEARASAGRATGAAVPDQDQLDLWLQEIWTILADRRPTARYRDWVRALDVVEQLRARTVPAERMLTLLNGGWYLRLVLDPAKGDPQLSELGDLLAGAVRASARAPAGGPTGVLTASGGGNG